LVHVLIHLVHELSDLLLHINDPVIDEETLEAGMLLGVGHVWESVKWKELCCFGEVCSLVV
jgi:hypothetical protein